MYLIIRVSFQISQKVINYSISYIFGKSKILSSHYTSKLISSRI